MRIAVLILGILGVLLGFIIIGVSFALPEITSNKVDFEEAMIGVAAGGVVIVFSFLLAILGVILVVMGRKKK